MMTILAYIAGFVIVSSLVFAFTIDLHRRWALKNLEEESREVIVISLKKVRRANDRTRRIFYKMRFRDIDGVEKTMNIDSTSFYQCASGDRVTLFTKGGYYFRLELKEKRVGGY